MIQTPQGKEVLVYRKNFLLGAFVPHILGKHVSFKLDIKSMTASYVSVDKDQAPLASSQPKEETIFSSSLDSLGGQVLDQLVTDKGESGDLYCLANRLEREGQLLDPKATHLI